MTKSEDGTIEEAQNPGLLYSPRPPLDYTRICPELGRIGVGSLLDAPEHRAQWNLFWLSEPAVDMFLGDHAEWGSGPAIGTEMLKASNVTVGQDLGGAKVADLLLTLTPLEFVERVKVQRHTHLAVYKLRGKAWVQTISERAQLYRGSVASSGNVMQASFGPKPVDRKTEAAQEQPATIMPLSFRKP